MGHKNPNPPTTDHPSTRKARRMSSPISSSSTCSSSVYRTSSPISSSSTCSSSVGRTASPNYSSSTCSSSAQSGPEPVQQTTQSAKLIEARGWISVNGGDQTDIQRASMPSFAALQRTKHATQSILPVKKHRNLAPAPAKPSRACPPEKVESIMSKNGNLKYRIPKIDPLPKHTTSVFPLAKSPPPPAQQCTLNVPEHPEPRPPFDPSKCTWRALRDVAFVTDNWIELSTEKLCALLQFRYARDDQQMVGVGRRDILAMKEFCESRGKDWYETEARELIKKMIQRDLNLLAEGREQAVSEDF